ncbi:uncharacterized protein LOC129600905 [Paramacrobiotus metropolitanus]|uniref:uncharacterized protein LOC129600905 n=1 Tax=Paramacrobiotus metropolitanus TaxID=2943436 RepID=UPI002445DF59|nr:uncharacterized protein LOC129600905 [Paramacrobiotus metropolitanus]
MQAIYQGLSLQILNVTAILNMAVQDTTRDWMVRRITKSMQLLAHYRQVNLSSIDRRFPLAQNVTSQSELMALSANLTVGSLTDLTHVLAGCANYTAFYASSSVFLDRNNGTAAFAWVVIRALRICCDNLFVDTSVADLPADHLQYNSGASGAEPDHQMDERCGRHVFALLHLRLGYRWMVATDSGFCPANSQELLAVVILSLAINTSGINIDDLMTTLRYQNLLQNISLNFINARHILWLKSCGCQPLRGSPSVHSHWHFKLSCCPRRHRVFRPSATQVGALPASCLFLKNWNLTMILITPILDRRQKDSYNEEYRKRTG